MTLFERFKPGRSLKTVISIENQRVSLSGQESSANRKRFERTAEDLPVPRSVRLLADQGLDHVADILNGHPELKPQEKEFLELVADLHRAFTYQQPGIDWQGRSIKIAEALVELNRLRADLAQRSSDNAIESPSLREGVSTPKRNGGIDLNPTDKMIKVNGDSSVSAMRFNIDSAMLEQYRTSPGFTPVIMNVQPLEDLPGFLGVQADKASVPAA